MPFSRWVGIQNMGYPYTGYYSIIQRKELLLAAAKWKNLTEIMLSKRRRSQKGTYCMIPFLWCSRIKQKQFCNHSRSVVTWGLDRDERIDCKLRGTFWAGGYMTVCRHLAILLKLYTENGCVNHTNIIPKYSCFLKKWSRTDPAQEAKPPDFRHSLFWGFFVCLSCFFLPRCSLQDNVPVSHGIQWEVRQEWLEPGRPGGWFGRKMTHRASARASGLPGWV